jgi:hypothetical protein
MVRNTDLADRVRLSVSPVAIESELRLCAFALLNCFLTMHRVMAEHVGLEPVDLLILIATTTGNTQRAVRPEALPGSLRGSTPLPSELIVPMSRRAIARVTGIPKETVRRHVAGMIERGVLLPVGRGVRARPGLAGRDALATVVDLVKLHATCTEQLIEVKAIEPSAARRPRIRQA